MTYEKNELRKIAVMLGNPIGLLGIPLMVSILIVGFSINPLKGNMSALAFFGCNVMAIVVLATAFTWFYAVSVGRRFLASITQKYGPKTSKTVYNLVAKQGKDGWPSINIPAIAKAFGEA